MRRDGSALSVDWLSLSVLRRNELFQDSLCAIVLREVWQAPREQHRDETGFAVHGKGKMKWICFRAPVPAIPYDSLGNWL